MTFSEGDRVHLAGLGTGIVREARSGGRYAIEIKGRVVVAAACDLELASGHRTPHKATSVANVGTAGRNVAGPRSIDLHGKTAAEVRDALESFVNDALLAGHHEVRVIHGRSGGRVKTAVHQYLRRLTAVASFRLDPHNAGVTIVTFA
jgi:DNA mismatch repair protein MutS2